MQTTLFDNDIDIPNAAQRFVWDSLQIPISDLKLNSNSTVLDAIISTLAKEAIQKKSIKAAEVLLRCVFRPMQILKKGGEGSDNEKIEFNEWLQKIESESKQDV